MKTKLILSTMGLLIVTASMLLFSSCSKKADGNLSKDQLIKQDSILGGTTIDQKNLTESDEDLTTVDYKVFYDQLAPHGQWVQVRPEDIGLKSKVASSKTTDNNRFSLLNLLGIKDAYAEADADMGLVFVWKPSPDLGVTVGVGETPEYRPYRNGQWINTDDGWYFRGRTPEEETVSHYGRWSHSPDAGWLWVPGRVWAPAWVDWRQNDDYESWAPLPPSDYLIDGSIGDPRIDDDDYFTVDRHHFLDPDIYRYDQRYDDNGIRIVFSGMIGTVGISVVDNIIINRGPDVNIIQNFYGGRHIDMINIQHCRNFNEVKYSDKEYNVYTPDFKRFNNKGNKNVSVNEPKSFKNYNDVRKENNGNNNGNTNVGKDKGNQNVSKDNGNKQKSNDNGFKPNNNTKVNKSSNNTRVNKSSNNTRVDKPSNNTRVNKPSNNTRVNKPNNNTNVNRPSNNTSVNKPSGNNNGSKTSGNKPGGNNTGKKQK